MTEVVASGDMMGSSPDQSPQHSWPMVPVLQTLTVLSDGEEEQMEQKMGIENGYGISVTKLDSITTSLSPQTNTNINNNNNITNNTNGQKRKVGRPITSVKTMNRSFPAVDEIRSKLEAGECYVRPRASSSSSDVWALFQEVAYKDNHFFTGIVQCKTCHFLTRYHGQITGTSHMRRHHCFSLLFPNSTPANRKPKNNQHHQSNRSSNSSNNHNGSFNMDADSTTPRMLKKFKKDISSVQQQSFKSDCPSTQIHLNESLPSSLSPSRVNNNNANITIHPTIPLKKKFKNGNIIPHERSLISSVTQSNGGVIGCNPSQSILRSVNGYNSPSSSSASSPHQSSSSSSPTCNVPTNNLRIQNSKQDLRERLIQFCWEELVPLKSVASDSFRIILQSHLRLCTSTMLQQFLQQPQLMNLATTLSTCMNHLPSQIPDYEQLRSYLEVLYRQCRDKIRQDVNSNLENNAGSALVCDSDHDACIISVYYVDIDWRLTEAILSASAMVFDINQFVARTLENYVLQDRKKLSKFTFVSHGGQFGGVSVCLSSMAHIVDKVVDETLVSIDEMNSGELPHLNDLFDSCHEIAMRFNIQTETNQYDVDWISKYEQMKTLLEQRHMINVEDFSEISSIDFNLIAMIVKLLEPFRTASHELRQCFTHPTLCHVLLYFHKLKKVLSNNSNNNHQSSQAHNLSAINNKANKVKSSSSSNSNGKNKMKHSVNSESDSDSTEERYIDFSNTDGTNGGIELKNKKNNSEDEDDDEEEDDDDNEKDKTTNNTNRLMDRLKKLLMENLNKYYQVQSLHRIATFLWPNFRLLKMLTIDEQKEVHEDVRKLIQTHILTRTINSNNNQSLNDSNNKCQTNIRNNKIETKNKSKSNFDEWEIFSDQDQDEVDKYLSVQLTSCSEHFVLHWWKEHSNEFPKLSQLAKWILSIPASVTTRERFQISKNRQVDDMLLFLHCNMQTDKFDLASIKKLQTKYKSKHKNSNMNNYASSLIAN